MTANAPRVAPSFSELRGGLAPFAFDAQRALPAGFAEYARYYGIDFAQRLPVTHMAGTLEANGYTLVLQCWRPEHPRDTVFVVHGYFDHVGIYGHPVEYFLARNYAVVSYDQPGHGLSSGPRASIDSFGDYVAALEAVVALCRGACPAPWHILGQSMGGAVTMTYLLNARFPGAECPFREVVLLAPLVYPTGWSWGKWLHLLLRNFVRARPRVFADNSHDREFVEFVRNADPLQPQELPLQWVTALKEWIAEFEACLPSAVAPVVIQGTDDDTVDWQVNMAWVAEKFPAATIHYLTSARHHLVNESPALRGKITELLDGRFQIP